MKQETEYYRLREYVNRARNVDKLNSGMIDRPDVDRKTEVSHAHHVSCKDYEDTWRELSRIERQVCKVSTEILEDRSRSSWFTHDQRQVSTNCSIEEMQDKIVLRAHSREKETQNFFRNKESHEHDVEASVLKFGERSFTWLIEIDEKHDRIRENLNLTT